MCKSCVADPLTLALTHVCAYRKTERLVSLTESQHTETFPVPKGIFLRKERVIGLFNLVLSLPYFIKNVSIVSPKALGCRVASNTYFC